jgi:NAD(P)-dependent dehydrogenase (short-subunit alcohol dehydrogenase family)
MAAEMTGKVVIVTGATGNLGRAVVKRFAAENATLVLVDRDEGAINQFAAELGLTDYVASVTDAGSEDSVHKLAVLLEDKYGHIDVVVHTVGGFEAGKPVHESDLGVYERMMDLNARPLYVVGAHIGKHMVARQVAGKLVFVLARAALKGAKNMAAYTASKAAAQRIMESLSAELKDFGINVNGVAPSTIDTPRNRADMPNADFGKWVKPEELADAIYFLSSDAGKALHGTTLEVYGRA